MSDDPENLPPTLKFISNTPLVGENIVLTNLSAAEGKRAGGAL